MMIKLLHYSQVSGSKLTLEVVKVKMVAFANSVDLDGMAHNEPSHLDPHYLCSCECVPISVSLEQYEQLAISM